MKRDFLSLADFSREELDQILDTGARLKRGLQAGQRPALLAGKSLAMIFEKPSLRTRVTFEVGMTQLGGHPVYLTPADVQLGQRESVSDAALNLERWVDFIMARTYAHQTLVDLARHARIPVINGLSDALHPCQVLSDCLTVIEQRGKLDGLRIAFLGDNNNMARSWIAAAGRFPFSLVLGCPPSYAPGDDIVQRAKDEGADVTVTTSAADAVRDADVVYTDVWASMGQEVEAERRRKDFRNFQVNAGIMSLAKPNALAMHCLPAHRGEEITAEVIDGPQSIVFEQAENRLHVQKAILVWLNANLGE